MQVLKMDYKNDLFFGDRRYNKIDNSDGTISLEDVTEYRVVGDSFGAGDINKITSAIMGFTSSETIFGEDGSITEIDSYNNKKLTVFNDDGSITETLYDEENNQLGSKTTTFNDDGSISEVVV